ncbi:hypothetical protein Ancab_012722 [Ancistrocladus abbreviatus]
MRDVIEMEGKLNQLWTGTFKVRANRARFSKGRGDVEAKIGNPKETQGSRIPVYSLGVSYANIVKRPHIYDRQNQEGNRRGDQVNISYIKVESDLLDLAWLWGSFIGELKPHHLEVNILAKLRRAGLNDYDVWLEVNLVNEESGLGGKLARWFDSVQAWPKSDIGMGKIVWLRFLGLPLHAWSDKVFKKLVERWGHLVAIDAATKAQTRLDVARFAVLTPVLHHISLTAGSCVATGIGSSEDSSEAFFASLASLSMVPKSVGDDLATGKLTTAALHWESNTEVQNTLLVINDSANVIQEEPVCIDGSASGKFKWHQKFRDDKERMDGGEGPIIEGAEVDNLRLDLDPNCADFGDPESLWATTEKVLGLPVVAQLQLDNRKEGLGGPFYLCRLEDKAGEHLLFEPGPSKPPKADPTSIHSQSKAAKL